MVGLRLIYVSKRTPGLTKIKCYTHQDSCSAKRKTSWWSNIYDMNDEQAYFDKLWSSVEIMMKSPYGNDPGITSCLWQKSNGDLFSPPS